MELLENIIRKDGKIFPGDVLKIDGFLNHRMDISLINEMGKEFYSLFKDDQPNLILTIEASGIGIACLAAQYFGVPVVFAKKSKTSNISDNLYSAQVYSYTHKTTCTAVVSKDYLGAGHRVLIIDDFLALGGASNALIDICRQAGAEVVGIGIAVEKAYQGGGDKLRAAGYHLESLACIESMDQERGIVFRR